MTGPAVPRVPVLICGGGLTGLSAAVFLARQGVPATVVERHLGALVHPRARTVNPRSHELFRQAGLAGRISAGRTLEDGRIAVHAETMAGPERRRTSMDPPPQAWGASPCSWVPIDQDELERILREHAERLGADVRFGTELTGFEQDAAGVTAQLRDADGTARGVRAEYLIVADGARSRLRDRLGIGVHGPGGIGRTFTALFRADLSEAARGRPIGLCHVKRPAPGTVLIPNDRSGRWVFSAPYDPALGDAPAALPAERLRELIRAAVGLPGLAVEIVPQLADGTTVIDYDIGAHVADRFRAGRAFLAGDAAHVMPPTGAYGSGTGIQDAHNLAWKLAAVLRGEAAPELLGTYERERLPVAEFTLRQALLKMRDVHGRDVLGVDEPPLPSDTVVLGYGYGTPEPAYSPDRLQGRPGTRAPHVYLTHEGRRISTLDLYGLRPVLLTGPDGAAWQDAARPLELAFVGLDEPQARAHGISADGALLVRPDGFVAMRRQGGPDPGAVLAQAVRRLYGHEPGGSPVPPRSSALPASSPP